MRERTVEKIRGQRGQWRRTRSSRKEGVKCKIGDWMRGRGKRR